MTEQPQPSSKSAASSAPKKDPLTLMNLINQELTLAEYCFHWLEIQCNSLTSVRSAVLLIRDEQKNSFKPIAKWPLSAEVMELSVVAYGVIDQGCGLLLTMDEQGQKYAAAYPVHVNNELRGIVALQLETQDVAQLQAAMSQLQWSVGWLELYFNRKRLTSSEHHRAQANQSMELLAKVHSQEDFLAAAMAFVTELANRFECERVSIGFPNGHKIHVEALSHSAQFGKKMNLVRAISQAMEEALVAGQSLRYPGPNTELSAPDHHWLLEVSECASVMSLPIYVADKYICVVTFERTADENLQPRPFSDDELSYCQSISVLCAPALEDKRLNRRSLFRVAVDRSKQQLGRVIGVDYMGRKLALLALIAMIGFFSVATGEYRVAANVVLEGEVQRVVAAPYNGYIKDAFVKAGDVVESGQLLCQLDDRDLRLERENWLSQRSQYRHQYNQAFASHQRSEVNIAKAQMDQAMAQLSLADEKLARSQLVAPFDGVVISGDLSQRLGGFVEQGEVLFEVAPLDGYRIILLVDEKEIAEISAQQAGDLVLSAFPEYTFQFTVSRITPVTVAEEGGNFFRVEAQLVQSQDQQGAKELRPGMEGVGKIAVDERKLIWIWTRKLLVWVKLTLWEYLP